MQIQFEDRAEAGRFLATKLKRYANRSDVLVGFGSHHGSVIARKEWGAPI